MYAYLSTASYACVLDFFAILAIAKHFLLSSMSSLCSKSFVFKKFSFPQFSVYCGLFEHLAFAFIAYMYIMSFGMAHAVGFAFNCYYLPLTFSPARGSQECQYAMCAIVCLCVVYN